MATQPPQRNRMSTTSHDSGFADSQNPSKIDLIEKEDLAAPVNINILPLKLDCIDEVKEPATSQSVTHCDLNLKLLSPYVLDHRRGSAESNRSCSSNASTPASTRPLLSDHDHSKRPQGPTKTLRDSESDRKQVAVQQMPKSVSDQDMTYADEIILCDTVRCEMPRFVNNTDFKTLYSHLYSKKLLHDSDFTTLTSMSSEKERGNHLYMQILPHKGEDTYRRLYECLKNETEHIGHRDLVRILNKALKDKRPPESSSDSSPTEPSKSTRVRTQAQTKVCCSVQ